MSVAVINSLKYLSEAYNVSEAELLSQLVMYATFSRGEYLAGNPQNDLLKFLDLQLLGVRYWLSLDVSPLSL